MRMAFGTLWRFRFCGHGASAGLSLLRRNLGSETLPSLQRRSERLYDLLQRMRFPRVESFSSGGRTYQLPLSSTTKIRHRASHEDMQYLIGFFDGDGCVTMHNRDGSLNLQISQSIQQASVLVRFRDMLGGGIYRERDATGVANACLRWKAAGRAMMFAASTVGAFPSMKQAQLQIAMQGGVCAAQRYEVQKRLKALKHVSFQPDCLSQFPCSWSYFAGFFDAEGSIVVHNFSTSLALKEVLATTARNLHSAEARQLQAEEELRRLKLRCKTLEGQLELRTRTEAQGVDGAAKPRRASGSATTSTPSLANRVRRVEGGHMVPVSGPTLSPTAPNTPLLETRRVVVEHRPVIK
ncbi:unnamed protein product [Effrenium voratum]|nr:unnamed protein product [Effrenium voratum]